MLGELFAADFWGVLESCLLQVFRMFAELLAAGLAAGTLYLVAGLVAGLAVFGCR